MKKLAILSFRAEQSGVEESRRITKHMGVKGKVYQYYTYMMASKTRVLYTGVTRDLQRRTLQHKHKLLPGFTSRYRVTRLVYYEVYANIRDAIRREKQIKAWRRAKKVALVESMNPKWMDLSEAWNG